MLTLRWLFPSLLLLYACGASIDRDPEEASTRLLDTLPEQAVFSASYRDSMPPRPAAYEQPPDTVPRPEPDYDTSQWRELITLDSSLSLDLRYATANNFVGDTLYPCPRCFLRPEAAHALIAVHRELRRQGYGGLKMWDCYRPLPIQWKLWNKVPDRRYVADPRKGSMHNRGAAVDLTVTDAQGRELDMGTPYDFFGPKAYPGYTGLPPEVLKNRRLLLDVMTRHGFKPTSTEWWHFSFARKFYSLAEMEWNCP